jgi:hypothetical protein
VRLTDATIRGLRPRENIYEVYDDEVKCLGVRVCPGGAKTFTFFYRLGGRKKRLMKWTPFLGPEAQVIFVACSNHERSRFDEDKSPEAQCGVQGASGLGVRAIVGVT